MSLAHLVPEPVPVTKSRYRIPTTNPIPLLLGNSPRYYSIAHTFQLLLYYYLRSRALINDPVSTLLHDLIPLSVCQASFCVICLPQAGTWTSSTDAKGSTLSKNNTATGKVHKKQVNRPPGTKFPNSPDITSRIISSILATLLVLLLTPVPLAAVAMVLGAPLYPLSLIPHTFLLAVHVGLLATTPLFYSHSLSPAAWRDLAGAWLPFDKAGVWGGTVGCLVGGWIGAVPMALDWDRDWQAWPCTVLWGAVAGWALGRVIGHFEIGVGTRIDMSVEEQLDENTTEKSVATNENKKNG